MKLVVGLGNPGKKYKSTRHNAGYLVVDRLFTKLKSTEDGFEFKKKFDSELVQIEKNLLVKPHTFMNDSGLVVKKLFDFYKVKVDDLWVIHDDLDLILGSYKIQKGRGPREHKGVLSIEAKLGIKDFWRVRVGVDNRGKENRIGGEEYVLEKFSSSEFSVITASVENVVEKLMKLIS